ncbi:hypothetical protein WJ23_01590 [Burkholderia lata]|nr:hypothetical protein WJ23_01590 [Burkholderia lata]
MSPPISRVVRPDLQAIHATRLSGVFQQLHRVLRQGYRREVAGPTPTLADFRDWRDIIAGQLPASVLSLMRLLALVMTFMALTAHAAGPSDVWCRSSAITRIRQQALADGHAPGRPAAASLLAAYDRLKPALDAGCLGSAHVGSAGTPPPLSQDAIAYAWLLNDASTYLVGAGDNAPEGESGGPACIDVLQPLLGDDMRPRPGLPRRLVDAISVNILQCAAHCISPSCKPTNVNIWSAYRSESSAYARHPACPYDARLVQLNASTCVGFDAGAFSAPHPSDDAGKLACEIQPSTSTDRCPALVVLTRDQGRNTTRRFPPGDGSALRDPSTACTVRSTGIDASGKHFALMGEGGDCFGGTAYSLIEEIYALRDGQPVLVKRNSADF